MAMRASILALALAGLLGTAAAQAPGQTPAAASAPAPTIRPEIAPPLQAAQMALGDKQFEQALQHLQQAEAVAGRTAYETYLVERMRFLAHAGLRDAAGTLKALEAALETGQAEPELKPTLMDQASNAAYALKDYEKTVLWGRRAIEAGAADDVTRLRLGQALYLQGQHPAAAQVLEELAARQRAAGRPAGEPQLRLQASNLLKLDDPAGYARVLEDLLRVTPKPEIWADRLARLMRQPGFDEALTIEIFRLSRRVGAFATAAADIEYAELALRAGYPAEAVAALDAGVAAGRVAQGADAAAHKAVRERAQRQAADDRSARAPDAVALLARDPALAFNAGWAQFTTGQREAGVALMRQAVERRPPADRARLRLASALAAIGDAAQARTVLMALRDAGAADGTADLARLSLIALGGAR
jgi:hypothetical protein